MFFLWVVIALGFVSGHDFLVLCVCVIALALETALVSPANQQSESCVKVGVFFVNFSCHFFFGRRLRSLDFSLKFRTANDNLLLCAHIE